MSEPTWRFDPQPPSPAWGVRSPVHKARSLTTPITVAPPPTEVVVCLHQGKFTARPLVAAGERVLTGQPIARHEHGALIHASITGAITAIAERPVPGPLPGHGPCIVIRAEGHETWHTGARAGIDPFTLHAGEVCERVAVAGIVGLGGALFPTARKLAANGGIEALIANGVECEPWITCDEALLRERAGQVVAGARIAMHALGARHAAIAVESNMPEARSAVQEAMQAAADPRLELAVVTARDPAGGERQLIELLTGTEVPSGRHPADIGYVVQNVATLAAITELFRSGRPLVSRIVTVTGGAIARPGNYEARIGTPLHQLVELAGGYDSAPYRLLMGGPMMGFALPDDGLPVTAATNCVVAALESEVAPAAAEMPCIRCGECLQVCPAGLQPQELHLALRCGDRVLANELGLGDCIECGCCDYVCPSAIPLTSRFVAARRGAGRHSAGATS